MRRLNTSTILFQLGNGKSFQIYPSADWKGYFGQWFSGDFDGDHRSDLIQIVSDGVVNPDYAHLWCSITDGSHYKQSDFNFRNKANPQHDYCVKCGAWSVEDVNGDGVSDLRHQSNIGSKPVHRWISTGTCDGNGFHL